MKEQIKQTVSFLKSKGISDPEIGIVLGTGLGKMVDHIAIFTTINYDEIPNFVKSTVEFHYGKLIYGSIAGKNVLAMQGRFHYYEGYSMVLVTCFNIFQT